MRTDNVERDTGEEALGSPGPASVRRRAGRMAPQGRAAMIRTCALRVAAREGIDGLNHRLVAAEAGTSVATVFVYFPTQIGLLETVLADVSTFLLEDIVARTVRDADTALSAIDRILSAFADSIDDNPDTARVWLDWSTALRSPYWCEYLEFHRRACGWIEGLIVAGQCDGTMRRDVDPGDAAHVIVGLAHMIAQMKFAGSPTAQVRRAVHDMVHSYIGLPAKG